jgi:hypothetical protein
MAHSKENCQEREHHEPIPRADLSIVWHVPRAFVGLGSVTIDQESLIN